MIKKNFNVFVFFAFLLTFNSAFAAQKEPAAIRGLDKTNFDTKTPPCRDFYSHVNGNWLRKNPIPDAYDSWNVFSEMEEQNQAILKRLAESAMQNSSAKPGSDQQLIGDFYYSAMDTATIENVGLTPLQPYLNSIAEINSGSDVENVVARLHAQGLSPLFATYIDDDLKNEKETIAYAYQGGLGLPDRDYYLKTDVESQKIRIQYKEHVKRIFELLGFNTAESTTKADQVIEMETALAKASLTQIDERYPENRYNMVAQSEAANITPHFSWPKYFKAIGAEPPKRFSMAPAAFFTTIDKMLAGDVSPEAWQSYFQWHLLRETAPYLNAEIEQQHFHFYGQILNGTKAMLPRWKRSLNAIDANIGEVMGKLFVQEQFPESAKKQVLNMIRELLTVYKERIENLTWMQDDTKAQALKKLRTFDPKIGYPSRWRSYKGLKLNRNSYVENFLNAKAFDSNFYLAKLGKTPDRTEWGMNPHQINAYYNPTRNEIVFPAGILQPPFYDFKADAALNYGAIGAIIGHEMTHGFDDEGSQYDASGKLKNWWSSQDKAEFQKRSQVLVQQYGKYQPLKGYSVNGQLTLGENIADLGGVTMAYEALQRTLKHNPEQRQIVDGLTPEQRFFMAWAQGWRGSRRPENIKLRLNVDPHAPAKFRTNGVVSNLPEFQTAFSCKAGDPMTIPESKRAKIW